LDYKKKKNLKRGKIPFHSQDDPTKIFQASKTSSDPEIILTPMEILKKICIQDDPKKHYSNLQIIGEGASGKVYSAIRNSNKTMVALKQMYMSDQPKIEILSNETSIMIECNHPNLVNFIEAYLILNPNSPTEDLVWISMEHVNGTNMKNFIDATQGGMNELQIIYVLKRVLAGLVYLHEKDIIHRDIKSDNILVSFQGDIKIVDFGFSVHLEQKSAKRKSHVGTCYWMAPEVISMDEYDNKVDLWSVGILAVEMFESKPPYFDEIPVRALFLVTTKGLPDLTYPDQMSEEFKKFISLLTKRNPIERPHAKDALNHPFLSGEEVDKSTFPDLVKRAIEMRLEEEAINKIEIVE